jgi:hypothetical protein
VVRIPDFAGVIAQPETNSPQSFDFQGECMDEKHQVEKTASEVFSRMRLKWVVAAVQENRETRSWDVEVQVPDGSELILSVPHGSPKEIKQALIQQAEEEEERLSSHG